MEKMTLLSLLLVSVPEAVLVAALGFLLVGIRINLSSLLIIGLLQGGVAYLVRLSPVFFGLHSILEAGLFLLILRLATRRLRPLPAERRTVSAPSLPSTPKVFSRITGRLSSHSLIGINRIW